jgi:hypothetical protein
LQPALKEAKFLNRFADDFSNKFLKNILSDKLIKLPLHSRYKNGQRKTLKDL